MNYLRKFLSLSILFILFVSCSNSNKDLDVKDYNLMGFNLNKEASVLRATVNPYIWHASLSSLDFVSLKIVDPVSGLIVSDWIIDEYGRERAKISVYILDKRLRPDALKVKIEKQIYNGTWQRAPVNPYTIQAVEDSILDEAQKLFLSN